MKQANKLREDRRGTSLIELVIYITISSILLVEVSGIMSQVVYNQIKLQTIAREDQTARTLMRTMSQNVEEATTINSPSAVNASSSSMNLTDVNSNTIIYSLTSGVVYKKVNAGIAAAISPNDVYVTTLTFTVESEGGVSPSINIKLDIQQNSTNSSNLTHYETTAAQRKI